MRAQLWRIAIGEAAAGRAGYEAAVAETRPVDRVAALDRIQSALARPAAAAGSASPVERPWAGAPPELNRGHHPRGVAHSWSSAAAQGAPPEFNLFTNNASPMHAKLVSLLAALEAGARIGAPPLRRHAALLCAARLLYYLEPLVTSRTRP